VSELHEERLNDERARAVALIAKLTGDFDAVVEASSAVATDDEHDPEGATIAYERAQIDAVLSMTRAHLVELDLGLARVRDGTYRDCLVCGRPIGEERLKAKPAATSCVACASNPVRPLGG
jgi:DnaK suppressor protein